MVKTLYVDMTEKTLVLDMSEFLSLKFFVEKEIEEVNHRIKFYKEEKGFDNSDLIAFNEKRLTELSLLYRKFL